MAARAGLLALGVCTASATDGPLQVGSTNRHLIDAHGIPAFIHADTPWSLIIATTKDEAETYLEDRRVRGFNTLITNLIEHQYDGVDNPYGAPDNRSGDPPFLTPGDFSTPNEAYFTHADWVIDRAAQKGLIVMLTPCYAGLPTNAEGWHTEIIANGVEKCRQYGRWVGARYRNRSNIIWVMYGDHNTGNISPMMDAMAEGILEFDPNHLMTAHLQRGQSARSMLEGKDWLKLNTAYTGEITHPQCLEEYARSPVMPFVLFEARYENYGEITVADLRRQAYSALLSGACGHAFGNRPIWPFESGWKAALDSPGARSMTHLKNLFGSRSWTRLEPDADHSVVISGYGSAEDYAACARTPDGSSVIAYLPETAAGITVNLAQFTGMEVAAWWFNPSDGSASLFATYAAEGIQRFSRPDSRDWVLVLDDAALPFSSPGTLAAAVTVSTPSLPSALLNVAYSVQLEASGGIPPYSWSLAPASGPLPLGLNLSTDGTLSGIATAIVTRTLSVKVLDANSNSATQALTLAVIQSGNSAPTVSDIENATINENTVAGPIAFTIADAETSAASLTVTGTSSNSTLVPTANISFGGDDGNRTVSVQPATNQTGTTTVTITVSDGSLTANSAFLLTVVSEQVAPTVTTHPANVTITSGQTASFTVAAIGTPANFSYSWQILPTAGSNPQWADLVDGGAYSGAATATLSVGDTLVAMSGHQFRCIVSNGVAPNATSNAATLSVARSPAIVTLGSLASVYDGSPHVASVTTSPAGLATTVSYNGSTSPPKNAGTYAVVASVTDPEYAGSATGTLAIARASATISLGATNQAYNGLPRAVTVNTAPSGLPVAVTYNGSAVVPINAGSHAVAAVVTDPNYIGSATATLVIQKAQASISIGDTVHPFDGESKAVSITTNPPGLNVIVQYDGRATPPAATGSYGVTAEIQDQNYFGSAAATLSIGQASALIALSDLAHVFDGTSHSAVVTTNPAGLATSVTYAGSAEPPTNAGSYAVVASINDPNYTGTVTGTLTIARAPASISLGATNQVYSGLPRSVTVTTSPGALPVTVTYNDSATVPKNAGSYRVTAVIADPNHTGTTTATLTIQKAEASIAIGNTVHIFDGERKTVSVTTIPAGLSFTVGYDGAATPPAAIGTYAVAATVQDQNYSGTATATLSIGQALAPVTLSGLVHVYDGQPHPVIVTTEPAGLATRVTYATSPEPPVNAGDYAVEATILDSRYVGSGAATLTISRAPAKVTLSGMSHSYDGNPKLATATTEPEGLPVKITYNGVDLVPIDAGVYNVSAALSDPNHTGSAAGAMVIASAEKPLVYSGVFSSGGWWAAFVRPDGSGRLLGYMEATQAGIADDFLVRPDGSFSVVIDDYASKRSESPSEAHALAALAGAFLVEGVIHRGTVNGIVAGPNLTFTGAVEVPGPFESLAGYYRASAILEPAGGMHVLVSSNGLVRFVALGVDWMDAGIGSFTTEGALDLAGVFGTTVSGTVSSAAANFSVSVPNGAAFDFIEYQGLPDQVPSAVRLANISARGTIGTGSSVLIGGFVVGGNKPKRVLLRAVGPGLKPLLPESDRDSTLIAARLALYRQIEGTTELVATNAGWDLQSNDAPAIVEASEAVGAFGLQSGSRDAVLLLELAPALYTFHASTESLSSGVGLVEAYELPAADVNDPKLINLSTRGAVQAGVNILISGFVITGNTPKQVLIRGIGPGLTGLLPEGERFSVLRDPRLELYDANRQFLVANDDWMEGDGALIAEASRWVGAFPLAPDSKDAALLLTLSPGQYTAHCLGADGSTGLALVEVYDLP